MTMAGHWGYAQSITVKCPPCRPVSACNLCWETQQQAANACENFVLNKMSTEKHREGVNQQDNLISIYPNPISEQAVIIRNNSDKPVDISIMNQLGVQMRYLRLKPFESYHVEQLSLAIGTYHILYKNENGKPSGTKRLIVIN